MATISTCPAGANDRSPEFGRRDFLKAVTGVAAGCAAMAPARLALGAVGPAVDSPAPDALVLYQSGETWDQVTPGSGAAAGTPVEGLALIGHGLARVQFRGSAYPVERERLYRFMTLPPGLERLISLRHRTSLLPLLP